MILVIAEHNLKKISKGTRACIAAAKKLNAPIEVLLMGNVSHELAQEAACIAGVVKVHLATHACLHHALAEPASALIATLATAFTHVMIPASTFGKNILPRAAALLQVSPLSDVCEIVSEDVFKRPIYAGNVILSMRMKAAHKLMTIRTTAFAPEMESQPACAIENNAFEYAGTMANFVKIEAHESARPELTSARVVVSGGRGLGEKENFKWIESLADKLHAAVGASRAAVDAGFVPNDYQVGQTGKTVAPELYIAVGISGAIQHVAGMKDSKVVVAINKDPEAPIFQVADYGLVGDLFEILPKMIALL